MGKRCQVVKKYQISTRHSNSTAAIPDKETYESTPFIHTFSYLIFLENPPIFPNSFFWETHQFFLPHFFGKPTNFSYLIFLGTHQFFLSQLFEKPTNFSYLIFLGNPPIWLMKLLKKLHLMRFLATISVIIWNFCKLFTMKEGTIDTYKTTPPLLSYLIRVLRNLSLKI